MTSEPQKGARDYVLYVMKRTGFSASKLAKEAGLSTTTLTRTLNDPKHRFTLSNTTLNKIREFSNIDYAPFLSLDLDTVARSIHMLENNDYEYPPPAEFDAPLDAIVVMGEVQAGIWREVQFLDDTFLGTLFLQPTHKPLLGNAIGLIVRGESLNKIAKDADILVVESTTKTGTVPHDGELVIVERKRHQEGLIEVSAKRLRGNGTELWPESTDPRFQEPLVLGEHDDETVQIIGLVHYIVRTP